MRPPRPGPAAGWTQDSPGVAGKPLRRTTDSAPAMSSVLLTTLEDDDDLIWAGHPVTVPREDVDGVKDVGLAYLGYPPGAAIAVPLSIPVKQAGAGSAWSP